MQVQLSLQSILHRDVLFYLFIFSHEKGGNKREDSLEGR